LDGVSYSWLGAKQPNRAAPTGLYQWSQATQIGRIVMNDVNVPHVPVKFMFYNDCGETTEVFPWLQAFYHELRSRWV
jgi:hypothetical protein